MTAEPARLRVLRNSGLLTAGQHLVEAKRLLYVIDEELQDPQVPRTISDLALLALAHTVHAAVAVDVFGEDV